MFTLFLLIYNFYKLPEKLIFNPYTSINSVLVKWGSNDEPVISKDWKEMRTFELTTISDEGKYVAYWKEKYNEMNETSRGVS